MNDVFKKSNWVWSDDVKPNSYVAFIDEFTASSKNTTLNISVDSKYAVWLNGNFVEFNQYSDFPFYKVYDSIDMTPFVTEGKNKIAILANYIGCDTSTYYKADAGLIYEVVDSEGNILACSSKDTLYKIANEYQQGEVEFITGQLGFSYHYDFRSDDGWRLLDYNASGFKSSALVDKQHKFFERPIDKLKLNYISGSRVIAQGFYENYHKKGTVAYNMQKAKMSSLPLMEIAKTDEKQIDKFPMTFSSDEGAGLYFIVDLNKQSAGYLTFDVEVDKDCKMYVGFGEHLEDLRVRTLIDTRNFAVSYKLRSGKNATTELFTRFGLRYLQVFIESNKIKVSKFSVMSADYEVNEAEMVLSDKLHQKIYQVGVDTLKLCMHEHYEDCPWREQALYAMDSRNQMLFGYYTFGELRFPKSNIRLMGLSQDSEGLLDLCAPARTNLTIPSFNLYWIVALKEYIEHSDDLEFGYEMLPVMEKILENFDERFEKDLLPTFTDINCWNFYEWSQGLDGGVIRRSEEIEPILEAPLNLLYVFAARATAYIYERLGEHKLAKSYIKKSETVYKAFEQAFYDEKDGLFYSFKDHDKLYGKHELTQSIALYLRLSNKDILDNIQSVLKNKDNSLIKLTLSNFYFKYQGLINYNENNIDYVLQDIEDVFGAMLFEGSTSFWETAKGAADFEDAGSLCHAWSSIPCYVYFKNILGVDRDQGASEIVFNPAYSKITVEKAKVIFKDKIFEYNK